MDTYVSFIGFRCITFKYLKVWSTKFFIKINDVVKLIALHMFSHTLKLGTYMLLFIISLQTLTPRIKVF